jgi:hypothetical protein
VALGASSLCAEPLAKSLGLTPTVVPAKDFELLLSKLRVLQGNALVIDMAILFHI